MWNEPTPKQLAKVPKLHETAAIPPHEKIIYLHFFVAGCDWYIAEYNGDDIFFGFVILNGDYLNAEWGCIPFNELKAIKLGGFLEIDNDLFWEVRPAIEVEKIRKAFCHSHWNKYSEPESIP